VAKDPSAPKLHGEPGPGQGHAAPDPRVTELQKRVCVAAGVPTLRLLTTPFMGVVTNSVLAASFYYTVYMHWTQPSVGWAVACGLLCWLFAGFIQHEACHGALSRSPWVNYVGRFACTLPFPVLDAREWFIRHVVQHHPFTNTR